MTNTVSGGKAINEIRLDMISFWAPLREAHFPNMPQGCHSAKWVEKFSFSPSEDKVEVVKITEYDVKQSSGSFFELVEGSNSGGYTYRNKEARVLYFYKFNPDDVRSGKLQVTSWNHSTKGTETGYVLRLQDMIEVSIQPTYLLKADPNNVLTSALAVIKGGVAKTPTLPKQETLTGTASTGTTFSTVNLSYLPENRGFVQNNGSAMSPTIGTSALPKAPEDDYTEKGDDHITKLTIRDEYCITQNVPLSNKKWLNELIIQGRSWQQQQQAQ
jgi:hypothetical protein